MRGSSSPCRFSGCLSVRVGCICTQQRMNRLFHPEPEAARLAGRPKRHQAPVKGLPLGVSSKFIAVT